MGFSKEEHKELSDYISAWMQSVGTGNTGSSGKRCNFVP